MVKPCLKEDKKEEETVKEEEEKEEEETINWKGTQVLGPRGRKESLVVWWRRK